MGRRNGAFSINSFLSGGRPEGIAIVARLAQLRLACRFDEPRRRRAARSAAWQSRIVGSLRHSSSASQVNAFVP
jgi:hypothetical protein